MRRLLLVLLLFLMTAPAWAQPAINMGPGYVWSDNVQKGLIGVTGVYRVNRWSPNVVVSWSDPWNWEPNLIQGKVNYTVWKHKYGILAPALGVDGLRIRDEYIWDGAAYLTSIIRVDKRTRWVVSALYRPEPETWAVITRMNVVLWSGK